MFDSELKAFCDNMELVSIHSETSDYGSFTVGYIVGYNEEHYILALISPYGRYDGFLLKERKSIVSVEHGGKYESKIERLASYYHTEHESLDLSDDDLRLSMLNFASERNFIVAVELNASGYNDCTGYVKIIDTKSDEISCTISLIDEYGDNDGEAVFLLDDITELSVNTEDEIILKILHEARKIK